jgi:hypothetical protein
MCLVSSGFGGTEELDETVIGRDDHRPGIAVMDQHSVDEGPSGGPGIEELPSIWVSPLAIGSDFEHTSRWGEPS